MVHTGSLLLCSLLATLAAGLNPDAVLERSIAKYQYPVELHKLVTEDGYVLTMSRIPARGKPALLLVAGLTGSAVDYTVQGPGKSLAFVAADAGFDVWLGNNRGTTFSKNHTTRNVKSREYWQYSFHELGYYDLPAMVDHVLWTTGQKKLQYVGHSQGTTQFFVLCSLRPQYNDKFAGVHLSSPVAFVHHATTPAVYYASRIDEMLAGAKFAKTYEIFGRGGPSSYMDMIVLATRTGFVQPDLILTNMWYFIGYHDSINRSMIPEILSNTPAGGSVFQIVHYLQLYNAKRFQQYDYGTKENILRYGSSIPPEYPLHKITAPVYLYYSDYDNFNQPEDLEEVARRLPNVVLKYKVPVRRWNHLDFYYDYKAYHLYRVILDTMKAT